MFTSLAVLVLVALTGPHASAAVLHRRAEAPNDIQILNYALTLEHLENAFYTEALSKFDDKSFGGAGLNRSYFQEIASHEGDHVEFLTTALGDQATKACNYSFPYSDIKGFLALSMVLEGVGVSAYLGAAGLITNKAYLTAAGSILTTESRHSAYISAANAQAPWSKAFDIPLSLNEVYSLAAPFITSCPLSNPTLPVKSFPALNLTSTSYTSGSNLTVAFNTSAINASSTAANNTQLYIAFLTGLNAVYVPYDAASRSVIIPAKLTGTVYAVLSSLNSTNGTAPTDDTTLAGPAVLLFPNNATATSAAVSGSSGGAKAGTKTSGVRGGIGGNAFGWTVAVVIVGGLVTTML